MIAYLRRKPYEWTDAQLEHPDIVQALYDDIRWRNGVPYAGDTSLGDAGVFYFRAVGNAVREVERLVGYAVNNGIRVVDEYLTRDGVGRRPKSLLPRKLTVPTPAIAEISHMDDAKEHDFPFILKPSKGGRRGDFVFLIRGIADVEYAKEILGLSIENGDTAIREEWPWIVQEYIPNNGDYRAFVLGYETISVTKRRARDNERLQIVGGQKTRRFRNNRWPQDIAQVAEQAARDMGVEVAGIDLVRGPNGPCVIEVNEAPMWHFCQKRTRIDIGGKIKEWLLRL